ERRYRAPRLRGSLECPEGLELAAGVGDLRELRPDWHDPRYRLRRSDRGVRVPLRVRELGERLRPPRTDRAVRGEREASVEPAVVRDVGPLRRDLRGGRQ